MNQKKPNSPDGKKPNGRKEELELQRLKISIKRVENELKWNSGWRRFVDRLPVLLGVSGVLIGTLITLHSWNTKNEENTLVELQRNLIVPTFTASAAEALTETGDKGYRILWLFLSNVDSSSNDVSKRVFDALLQLAKANESKDGAKSMKIFSNLLLPLLTFKENGGVYRQTLEFINHVYTKLNEAENSITDSNIKSKITEAFNSFQAWEIRWHEKQKNEFYSGGAKWIKIPSGPFLVYDNYLHMEDLDEFIVHRKTTSNLDSARLHNLCDSLDLTKNDLNTPISKIIKELKIKHLVISYSGSPITYIQQDSIAPDSIAIELIVDPDLEFRFSNFKLPNNETQIFLLKYKFTYGTLGTRTNIYPYDPKTTYRTRIRYLRYKNNAFTKLRFLRSNIDARFKSSSQFL